MSEAVVAKRYADALFQLGVEQANLDQLSEELKQVRTVFLTTNQLTDFLEHPRISNEKKKQFLDEVFQDVHIHVKNLLKLLVERHRINVIPAIADQLVLRMNEAKGVAEATVYSVRELSNEEQKQLELTLAKRFNKHAIQLENKLDPSIIGGIRVQMGNTIVDGSIKGKLKRIEREIVTANN